MMTTPRHLELAPFGLLVTANGDAEPTRHLPLANELHAWVREHRVVVLRQFPPPADLDLIALAETLGDVLAWDFGAINELRVKDDAKNYLYTSREVPFHWDGAFVGVGRIPAYILFHCIQTPATGGETLFCDTTRLLANASAEDIERWSRIRITYTTEKVAHYGGSFTSPMLVAHRVGDNCEQQVLRFAEPVHDINPVDLAIDGVSAEDRDAFLFDMHERLRSPNVMLAHQWQAGDIVLADNHVLLHGRRAFDAEQAPARHIRRVNILRP